MTWDKWIVAKLGYDADTRLDEVILISVFEVLTAEIIAAVILAVVVSVAYVLIMIVGAVTAGPSWTLGTLVWQAIAACVYWNLRD